MQLWRLELPTNSHRQGLATPRLAEALCRLFFSLSRAQNRPARSAAVRCRQKEFDCRYENVLTKLVHRRGRSGWDRWMCADSKAGGAGEGGAGRFAVRPGWLGRAVSG